VFKTLEKIKNIEKNSVERTEVFKTFFKKRGLKYAV